MKSKQTKLGLNAAWSMAVGGMVGGGIFSVLGVLIETAGKWAWLSFLIAGLIALASGHSYSQLSLQYKKGGGAFTFLNEIGHPYIAGSLSWLLIAGYILTLSVYAFTFGHYTAYVFDFGEWLPRVLALGIILLFALINLHGVSNSSKAEILMVWVKLLVLVGIACYGLSFWSQDMLSMGDGNKSLGNAIIGAATIFMAYEGFQLLSYDYDDIDQPQKTLPRATFLAIISVIAVYILVALGATMIVGADVIAENKEVALAIAGKEAFGFLGLAIVTIAVAFSTGSAINATLFSTARLAESVAKQHDLPQIFFKENDSNIPLYSIGAIAALAAVLSVYGSLSMLVDSASLIFLITFSVVNFLAYIKDTEYRIFSLLGAIGCVIAIILSVYHQLVTRPLPLFFVMGAIITILTVGTWVLKKLRNPVKN